MKNLFLIFILSTSITYAQNLTLEQTEDYVNEIFKTNSTAFYVGSSNTGYKVLGVKIKKSGTIALYKTHLNDEPTKEFNSPLVSFSVFDVDTTKSTSVLVGNNGKTLGSFNSLTEENASKLMRVFAYLKKICDKSSDPFAN